MGDTKLYLLLLLCTVAFAQEESAEEESPPCLLAKRFKSFRNYVYQYETEALNGVSGTSNLRNGAKATCKVEIDVPQTCSYIVRTPECTLSEVSDIDPEGLPVYGPAAGADAFQAAMALHPLKLTVEGASKISLFPEEDEPINILNIKRGIISALLVPVLEEENNKNMATLHGMCKTDFAVNAREDIATDVTVTRHLSQCDGFSPKKDIASPLALISGLHIPLSKLISSTQTCNYKFDNEKKHMTEGSCTEKHILLPFSHQEKYGVLSLVKQTLALQETSKINDRVFDHNEGNLKALQMEAVEDKSPAQTTDAVLATLRDLSTLSQGKRRAHLFQKLVTELRGLKGEALSPAVPEMVEVSGPLTWQALAQCGTPECSSAIMQILRTMDKTAVEVDAAVYAMGLLPNPTSHLVQDVLSMAQYKQSKPILYGLSNIVRRVYKIEGKVTPEITAVSEYMASLLGDCSGDKDQTFLALRVIGNMGQAMEAANPALKSALLQCMTQPAATPAVQQAAIQAFRKLTITEEARGVLLQTVLDGASPIQTRVAAYLVLMKDPEPSDLAQVINALPDEQDPQAKSFVASHLANILSSTEPDSVPMKDRITEALQGNELPAALEFSKFSRNYKMSNNLEGNVIFDSTGYLPKEIMLETTLKAFGYDLDVLEVGLDGTGLEPTFEALFGQDGFFPDTLSKALYWAGGKMPDSVNTLLNKMVPPENGKIKRQVPENILREISQNVRKLVSELKTHESPEALIYLKLLGAELGFIKTQEMEEMAYSFALLADNLIKMFPIDIMKFISSIDNELFIHYIIMDNEFTLPTASGVPLKVSLSGAIAPGIKGGLHLTPGLEISFMPSIGVEFVTEMGVHVPEFVTAGVAMHTNIYHESALNAKLAMSRNEIKLTIPAPQGATRLFEISNTLLSVTTAESKVLPPAAEDITDLVKCIPALPGMKACITLKYPGSAAAAPFFPLTGQTEVAVELEPTGQVTEYTATIAYEHLPENVDALKIILLADGAEPTEATATLQYDRNENRLTTDVHIPDCDIEAGVRIGLTEDSTNGKGIMIDITHKNIPQVSLIGRAKLEAMKDGMLQVQLAIPSLKTDATVTAALKRAEDLTLEIETMIHILESSSLQKAIFRLGDTMMAIELKSDLSSEVLKLIHHVDEYKKIVQDIMDMIVPQTDMTVGHIVSRSIETTNIWLESALADAPPQLLESLRQIPELYLPEKLFLKSEAAVTYQFASNHITLNIPVPLGGKSSEDLHIPQTLTTPLLSMPFIGLVIPSTEISVPAISIPPTYQLSLPLFGIAEVSAKVNSNIYNWEGSISVDAPSHIAKYKAAGDCPVDILSYTIEGTGALATTSEESITANFNTLLSHKFVDVSVSLEGAGSITDKVNIRTTNKIEATSPLGLQIAFDYTAHTALTSEELSGDGNLDGIIRIGSQNVKAACSQSFTINPISREVKGESTFKLDSPLLHTDSAIKGAFASSSGLEVNTEGSLIFGISKGSHKAFLTIGNGNLATSGTTTLQSGPLAFENVFNGGIDTTGTTLSIISKSSMLDMKIENTNTLALTLSTLAFRSQMDSFVSDSNAYKHDITVDIKPYLASVNVNNDVRILDISLNNEGVLKLQPYKIDLTGSLKGTYGDEELRHTYEINYADLTSTMKCSTNGKILGAHLIHNTDIDIAGLTSKLNSEARFNSQILRVDNTLRVLMVPFSFSIDSIFNSDGDMTLFGKHTGQLYSKLLLKMEPLAAAFSHDCRASTTHQLDIEVKGETHFDHKIDSLMTPQEQKATWRMKSKLNSHEYKQEIDIYNQPERTGAELSAAVFTDFLSQADSEIQEFSISSSLKYDKNSDSNVLHLSFIETLSSILGGMKASFVHALESLKQNINREEIRTRLESLPQTVSDFVREQDLENKVIAVKEKIIALLQEYTVTVEDLEASLENVKNVIVTILTNLAARLKSIVESEVWSDNLSDIIMRIGNELKAIDEQYEVSLTILSIITTVEDIIGQVDLEKLKDSSIAWLHEFEIKAKLQEKVSDLKQAIESFDLAAFIQDLKDFVSSFNVGGYIEKLVAQIPTEIIINTADSIKGIIISYLRELHIAEQINAEYTKVRDIIVSYELDKKIEPVLDKVVELIKQFKIEDTILPVVETLKSIDFPALSDKALQLLDDVVNQLKTLHVEQIIDLLNEYIDKIVKTLKAFDYNAFVDDVNPKLSEISRLLNEQIQAFEIPQKIEAIQEFVRWIQNTLLDIHGSLPENSLLEISLPELTLPKLSLENFDITDLQIPEFTLPSIPSEIIVPAIGKIHGEMRVNSPHYSIRTSAELQNSTTNPMTPQFTAYLSSQATSTLDILNFVLDVTTRVGFPKYSRIVAAETIKVTHTLLAVEHQGSVTVYGLSAQGSAKTTAKATTAIYTAELVNNAFFALEGGYSYSSETTYNHHLNSELLKLTNEVTLTQKTGSRLEAGTIHLAIATTGNGNYTFQDHKDELTHKSDLDFTISIASAKLTFAGNTDGESLKMKQTLNADGVLFRSITLNGRAETEAPFIKSSLAVVSGNADLGDLKIELKGSHDTELDGEVSGTISNSINLLANPSEIIIDLQNKGDAKVALPLSLSGKIDLQNDYVMTVNGQVQQINSVVLSRFNQYKYFHNVTLDNSMKETVISVAVNGEANLNILTFHVDIPEITVPFIGVQTPALHEVSLWENTGLKTLLTTTEQTIDINLKISHEKNPEVIHTGIDYITIPKLGNLILDLSLKSPVFSLNGNAGLQNQEDITAQFEVSSTSLFDILKSKLDGTSSLSRKKRGMKIATALSLEHSNVQGTHDSTINLNRRAVEASVATVAKVSLPILNLEINQELTGSTKVQPNMDSKTKMKFSFNLPLIEAIGKGDIDQTLTLEGLSGHISLDSSTSGKIDGTILTSGHFAGALNNEANIYLDANGLRSTLKTDANSSGNAGETNVWSMNLHEDLALEATVSRVYATCNLICNNEANVESFNTKGKHVAKGTVELIPLSTLTANLDIDISQPSTLGEAHILQNIALEITTEKQKLSLKGKEQLVSALHTYELLLSNDLPEILVEVSGSIDGHAAILKAIKLPIYQKNLWDVLKLDQATSEEDLQSVKGAIVAVCTKNQEGYIPAALSATVKVSSPIYSTTLTTSLQNHAPAYTASLKSSCASTLAFLTHDLDASATASLEGGSLSLNNKATFSHDDLKMDLEHAFPNIMRKKREDSPDASSTRHTLNVDITSPTFTDMSFRYVSGKDGISATLSAPTSGLLGLQMSDLSARLYGRYPSEPENDVEILNVNAAQNILPTWNHEAVSEILLGLKERLPVITASLYNTVDKYHSALFDMDISSAYDELKNVISSIFEGVELPEMSEFTVLIRNLLTQLRNTIKIVVDNVIQFLRELQVPGFGGNLTLPELTHNVMSYVSTILEQAVHKINDYLEPYIDIIITNLSNVKVTMPGSDEIIPVSQVLENLKSTIKKIQNKIVGMVRHLESPDVILQKLTDLVQDCATKAEELTRLLESDILDAVAARVNAIFNWVKATVENVYANLTREHLNDYLQHLIETIRTRLSKVISTSTDVGAPAAEDVQTPEDVEVPEEAAPVEEVSAAEEVPAPEEEPAAEDVPAPEEAPAAEDVPAPEEAPAAEDVPAPEEAPAAEDVPAPEEVPAAEEVPTPEELVG